MRYLGIDYGAKRIGLSVSDEGGAFAFPRETIPHDTTSIDRISDLVRKERIGQIVMGDTRTLSGAENPVTKEAENFRAQLEIHAGVPVLAVWETWSSIEASRFAPKGKEHDDAAAAAIILQRFLDAQPKNN